MKKMLQDSDITLFREAVEDALPIEHEYAEPYRKRPRPFPRPKEENWDDEEQTAHPDRFLFDVFQEIQ